MKKHNNTNYMTGYELAKFVNEMLTARGLKTIPPQMVYNYMKKQYIKTTDIGGQALVSESDAEAFAEKYVAKKLTSK